MYLLRTFQHFKHNNSIIVEVHLYDKLEISLVKICYNYHLLYIMYVNTVKPVLRGHLWDKENVAL